MTCEQIFILKQRKEKCDVLKILRKEIEDNFVKNEFGATYYGDKATREQKINEGWRRLGINPDNWELMSA